FWHYVDAESFKELKIEVIGKYANDIAAAEVLTPEIFTAEQYTPGGTMSPEVQRIILDVTENTNPDSDLYATDPDIRAMQFDLMSNNGITVDGDKFIPGAANDKWHEENYITFGPNGATDIIVKNNAGDEISKTMLQGTFPKINFVRGADGSVKCGSDTGTCTAKTAVVDPWLNNAPTSVNEDGSSTTMAGGTNTMLPNGDIQLDGTNMAYLDFADFWTWTEGMGQGLIRKNGDYFFDSATSLKSSNKDETNHLNLNDVINLERKNDLVTAEFIGSGNASFLLPSKIDTFFVNASNAYFFDQGFAFQNVDTLTLTKDQNGPITYIISNANNLNFNGTDITIQHADSVIIGENVIAINSENITIPFDYNYDLFFVFVFVVVLLSLLQMALSKSRCRLPAIAHSM
ncbi:MAG: hypothetical protein GY705_20650, partial [Bacteroidetes bacterium]|nr:hypothetical protein [Bacteroidota bacterium]